MTFGRMRWLRNLFFHWMVDPGDLVGRIPEGLELDTHGGHAWLSVAALEVIGPAPGAVALSRVERLMRYRQLNLRTYVTGEPGPGVLLLETRVDRALPALGARVIGMPYRIDRQLAVEVGEGEVRLRASGLALDGFYSEGAALDYAPASLERFLLDRPWVFGALPGGRPLYGIRVSHAPWRVREVAVAERVPSSQLGIGHAEEPAAAHLADELDVNVVQVAVVRRAAPPVGETVPDTA